MTGFLMFIGAVVFASILLFGAWYLGTHLTFKQDITDDEEKE